MSRNKKPRNARNNPAKRAARKGTSDRLHLLLVESFSEEVHLTVALNARLSYQRLCRAADADAHNDIAEYVMIVGHAIQDIPQLQDEARQIESAARTLDDVYDQIVAGIVPAEHHLRAILNGVNAIDRAVGSPFLKTAKLYQAERQVEAALRKLQNDKDPSCNSSTSASPAC